MLRALIKLWEKAEAAGYRSMASRGLLACPSCGARRSDVPEGPVQLLSCPSCGIRASAAEWTGSSVTNHVAPTDPVVPPSGTRITRSGDNPCEVVWKIPASGKSGGLLFFAIFWCAITAIVSGCFLMAFLTRKEVDGDMPMGTLIPFFGLFWALGLGMSYAAFRSKYARHRISSGPERVVLRRELFGRSTEKALDAAGITGVSCEVFYQKNYRPVFGIEIRGSGGKLRFGSMLTEEEKAWLVADMRRVMMKEEHSPTVIATARIRVARQAYFSIPLPKARSSLLPTAVLLLVIGTLFVFVGTRIPTGHQSPPGAGGSGDTEIFDLVFEFATQGFQGIWMLVSGIIALVGLVMLLVQLKLRGKETRLEGTGSEISIRTYRHGLVIENQTFPRTSVTDLRCSPSGSSNGKPMKRIELVVGDKAEKIAWWIDGDLADAFVAEALGALG